MRGTPSVVKLLPLAAAVVRHAARHHAGSWSGSGYGHHHHGPRGRGGFGPGGPFRGWWQGFEFPGFPGFPGGRGPRARRGDVRAGILHLLADRPMHGYEMIRELGERSGGQWRPSAGSIYPTLQLLEDEGLVESEQSGGKKLYTLTAEGRDEVARAGRAPWEAFESEPEGSPWHDLRTAATGLAAAVFQAGHAGSDEQMRRVVSTLNEAKSKIYRILGDDEPDDR